MAAAPTPLHFTLSSALDGSASPTSSTRTLAPSLDGPTPTPSRPVSILLPDDDENASDAVSYGGPTRVGSPTPSLREKEGKADKAGSSLADDVEKGETVVEDEYPEGGMRAWLCVMGSTLVLLATFGWSNSFGALLPYYHANQLSVYTTSQISWIGSAHLFITFAGAFGSGILFDRGYFRYQLALGSLFWLVGIFALSFAHTFWQIFLSQAVCMGLALGIFFSPCLSILGTYFRRRRAFVVGIAASGTAVGAVIFPVLLGQMLEKSGFPWAIRAAGFLMLALLLIANVVIRPRTLRTRAPPSPSSSSSGAAPLPPVRPLRTVLAQIVREPASWFVYWGVFGIYTSCFIPLFYAGSFAREYTDNEALQNYAVAIINATAVVSRIGCGLLADRLGSFNVALPLGLSVGVLTFGLIGATSTPALAAWLVLFGVAQGGWISVSASCFMSLSRDASELGLRSGLGFLFVGLATLIGSPIAGALLARTGGSYVAALCFGGAMAVGGCALLVLGRATQVRRRGTGRV
ncbi:uncharacterized protein JCM10292_001685 [Rhodotorula paludigena]|uniref:uncharacterized protein n=1 Tax=Rhodotorula paludigena TaxID=86838 RepID=UPI003182A2C3